eukprot:352695-Chlamydomonas_euryale.AAC.5
MRQCPCLHLSSSPSSQWGGRGERTGTWRLLPLSTLPTLHRVLSRTMCLWRAVTGQVRGGSTQVHASHPPHLPPSNVSRAAPCVNGALRRAVRVLRPFVLRLVRPVANHQRLQAYGATGARGGDGRAWHGARGTCGVWYAVVERLDGCAMVMGKSVDMK